MMLNILVNPDVAYVVLVLAFVLTILAMLAPGTGILELAALFLLVAAGFGIVNLPGFTIFIVCINIYEDNNSRNCPSLQRRPGIL